MPATKSRDGHWYDLYTSSQIRFSISALCQHGSGLGMSSGWNVWASFVMPPASWQVCHRRNLCQPMSTKARKSGLVECIPAIRGSTKRWHKPCTDLKPIVASGRYDERFLRDHACKGVDGLHRRVPFRNSALGGSVYSARRSVSGSFPLAMFQKLLYAWDNKWEEYGSSFL